MAKNFSDIIDEIMPLVKDGDNNTPFIIYRKPDDTNAPWFVAYPYPTEDAKARLAEYRESDPYAVMFTGYDFSKGSFPYVHDRVLSSRFRAEYDAVEFGTANIGELRALLHFCEDCINDFSVNVTDYLTQFERPLAELYDLLPISLKSATADYDDDKVQEAIELIESNVAGILSNAQKSAKRQPEDEAPLNKQAQSGVQAAVESGEPGDKHKRVIDGHYAEKFSVALAGREVFLAADENEDAPYLVCTARWDNPLGVTEYQDGAVSADYLEAMREFVDRVDALLIALEQERAAFPAVQPALTVADCVPGGLDDNLTGKVVVIKPGVLSPEHRTADRQLKTVQGGFGAEPNARGNAVFCKDLYSGKESRFERYDIAGVIDPAKLPEWAKEKLAYLDARKEPGVFAQAAPTKPAPSKPAKAANKTEERPQRKQSLLADLDASIKEAAQLAERKGGNHTKKRGDLEVD
jgi:hypothetical protein